MADDFASWLRSWCVFILVCAAARALGGLAPKVGLPLISGFLAIGAIAGPYALGLLRLSDLPVLSPVTQGALAFIAFSAGAELYLPELRSLIRPIVAQTSSIALFSFSICGLVLYGLGAMGSSSPAAWLADLTPGCRGAVSAIGAAIMVARSPASAIAVAKELRAKGIFTSTLLGVTVLCDVYVLILFALSSSVAESECAGEGFTVIALAYLAGSLVACGVLGWLSGQLLIFLLTFKRFPARYLVLPLGLGIFIASTAILEWSRTALPAPVNLEPLLLCIVGGYIATNRSKHRHRLLVVLQTAGPWVFLPFFTLTGASLNLNVLVSSLGFAVIMFLVRAVTVFLGSYSGGVLAGQAPLHNKWMWATLLTQAGVSLGLASEVGMSFPAWGRSFQVGVGVEEGCLRALHAFPCTHPISLPTRRPRSRPSC